MSNPTDNAELELRDRLVDIVDARRFDKDYKGGNFSQIEYVVEQLLPHIDTVCREAVYNELYNHVDADAKYYPEVLSSDHITVLERLTQLNPNKDTPNE